jgi:hypothetical protein
VPAARADSRLGAGVRRDSHAVRGRLDLLDDHVGEVRQQQLKILKIARRA